MLSFVELYDLLETKGRWLRPAKDEYCDDRAEHDIMVWDDRRCRSIDRVEEITMATRRLVLLLLLFDAESNDIILPQALSKIDRSHPKRRELG
jgi:hypothetical protein